MDRRWHTQATCSGATQGPPGTGELHVQEPRSCMKASRWDVPGINSSCSSPLQTAWLIMDMIVICSILLPLLFFNVFIWGEGALRLLWPLKRNISRQNFSLGANENNAPSLKFLLIMQMWGPHGSGPTRCSVCYSIHAPGIRLLQQFIFYSETVVASG